MNKNYLKKASVFFLLLMLIIAMIGCSKKPQSKKDDTQPIGVIEGEKGVGDGKDTADNTEANEKIWPVDSVTFSTTHGYSAFLKLYLELPKEVKASDLTKLTFALDTKEPLELRLYAGVDEIRTSTGYELTGETVVAEAVSVGTEQVEVDGNPIEQENYSLNLDKKDITRFYLSEGEGQNVEFNVDERATKVLSGIEGDRLLIGIYPNNKAPEFTIYNVSFTANGTEYSITLDENSAKPTRGSYLQFH